MSVSVPAGATVASDIDPAPPSPVAAVPRPEATLRALVTGALIGVVLAAGNVYTAIKVGIIDGGGITAALLAFGIFAIWRGAGRTPYGPLETNITQTTASSAAVMSFVTGVMGPIPALALMGKRFPSAAIVAFGVAVGLLGIWVAALLRRRLIVEEKLPFPTGLTTGEVIETMFSARQAALRRIVLLVIAAALAAAIAWFRDARPSLVPQGFMLGGAVAGVAAATLGLGISYSPLMMSIGVLVGVRSAAGMVLGAAIARIGLVPWLARERIVASPDIGTTNQWLVWPSLGLLLVGSFLPLLLDRGTIVRSVQQFAALVRRPADRSGPRDGAVAPRLWTGLLAAGVAGVVWIGWSTFGTSPLVTLAALALALVLANVCGRATGETDFGPAGALGTVTLGVLASRGSTSGIMGGAVTMGVASQTSQTLWALRAGEVLGASPRAQICAQVLGVVVGAAVSVPVYEVIASSYGLGTEAMPAVAAVSWKATAEAMQGLSALPRWGGTAIFVGLGAGVLLTVLGRFRFVRLLPSAAAVGVGFMLPFQHMLACLAGALMGMAARRVFRGLDQPSLLALAAGGMAGESLIGVVIAILLATGVL